MMNLTRPIPRKSRVMPPMRFAAIKPNISVHCDSHLEMCFYHLLEFDKAVHTYKPQPFSFSYKVDGKIRRYTPDVLVKYVDGHFESWEVKSQFEALKPKFQKKYDRLTQVFNEDIGHPLRLVTCDTIKKGCTVANLRELYRFRLINIPQETLDQASSILTVGQEYHLSELHQIFKSLNSSASAIKMLIAHGLLSFDFAKPLNESTILKFESV
ncbi:TnsA endonuclease N-terminal domain-containing protein [Thalassotalea psychrophila]|uniref:TnsA endonuclease N-terminal domain-containing protein n=1 Tax=Thalassotalea psychrophila TaxID=3065647 RepID=A0ABY9TWC2_9GAMM|nr:TnsA endonuclease N-terminal domain-containing protein [Colwelliaceae bacterium SQ149]